MAGLRFGQRWSVLGETTIEFIDSSFCVFYCLDFDLDGATMDIRHIAPMNRLVIGCCVDGTIQ